MQLGHSYVPGTLVLTQEKGTYPGHSCVLATEVVLPGTALIVAYFFQGWLVGWCLTALSAQKGYHHQVIIISAHG